MDSDVIERPLPTLINRSSKSKTLVVKECAGSGSGEVHTGLRLSHGGIDRDLNFERCPREVLASLQVINLQWQEGFFWHMRKKICQHDHCFRKRRFSTDCSRNNI
ncbi:uncharacterized protein LOC108192549 [Daucus carota subsp. sativus]|uniref:uncharacterized protein LOC108192549 n=1 Tax=Daucus carota subsp. sativus TaxID=79200 RepID=UPI0030839373